MLLETEQVTTFISLPCVILKAELPISKLSFDAMYFHQNRLVLLVFMTVPHKVQLVFLQMLLFQILTFIFQIIICETEG